MKIHKRKDKINIADRLNKKVWTLIVFCHEEVTPYDGIQKLKKCQKVFEHFKLIILCLKKSKGFQKTLYIFWVIFLFLYDVIRNILHGHIEFY